eukprot:NODE_10575_length_237_cov_31.468085_g9834_i0.p3 GENE.NODE_10575_length_237_cov_31.468085_g9834_i0~~NODE_10575_length_237_cov_31.468085_g9834_i0.p3  ORF type:complete len:55 (-),score=4.19 NODE_10575_length_237_cov_31.468085_g9834_i0:3-167(-)
MNHQPFAAVLIYTVRGMRGTCFWDILASRSNKTGQGACIWTPSKGPFAPPCTLR